MADILTNQVCASGLNGVSAVDEAHFLVQLTHFHCHGSFTGAGVTSEDMVQRRDL